MERATEEGKGEGGLDHYEGGVGRVCGLLQVVLPRSTLNPQRVLSLLRAIQRQNHNAYRSHRKHLLRCLLNSS